MVVAWFLWLPKTNPLFEISVVGALAVVWWRAIASYRAVRKVYETRQQLAVLSPEQFEQWCAHVLRALGYTVRHVGGQGDHGIDLFAERDRELIVVQCKRFTGTRTVGEPHIRDLFGAMHAEKASRAIVITAGYFTAEARAWAQGKPIELWDADRIVKTAVPMVNAVAVSTPPTIVAPVTAHIRCDRCSSEMLVRRNRSTGQPFYGCSRYPTCHFTRPVDVQASGTS